MGPKKPLDDRDMKIFQVIVIFLSHIVVNALELHLTKTLVSLSNVCYKIKKGQTS